MSEAINQEEVDISQFSPETQELIQKLGGLTAAWWESPELQDKYDIVRTWEGA